MSYELEERLGRSFQTLDSKAIDNIQRLVDSVRWVGLPQAILNGRNNVVGAAADLCHIPTMEQFLQDTPSLRETLFTKGENAYAAIQPRPAEHLSACFGVREAGFKAFRFSFEDIEVTHQPDGAPDIKLSGAAINEARKKGLNRHIVSISHEVDMALVFWIGVRNADDEFRNI